MPHLFPALIAKNLCHEPGLVGVNLTAQPGEIHAIAGYSGAGKTTFAKLLTGALQPSAGTIHLNGQLTELKNQDAASDKGVRILPQEWDLGSRESVADALQMEDLPRRFGFIDNQAVKDRAHALLAMVGLGDVDPSTPMCELGAGKQKLIQLAGILTKPISLLTLDDPTLSLTSAETDALFNRLSQFQYAETGILYLTPRAEEAMQSGDQVSVFREGRYIATHARDEVFIAQILGEMTGRDSIPPPSRNLRQCGPEVTFRAEGISVEHRLFGLSLKLKRGEVLGLLGKYGAGQSEAIRAMAGETPHAEGEVFLNASSRAARVRSRSEFEAAGVRLLDNPTRGFSVSARLKAWQKFHAAAYSGASMVIASTDPVEVSQLCDRIAIMVDGRIRRTLSCQEATVDGLQQLLDKG